MERDEILVIGPDRMPELFRTFARAAMREGIPPWSAYGFAADLVATLCRKATDGQAAGHILRQVGLGPEIPDQTEVEE
jgi:hypothetical protein